jgi:hypothetical protein
VNGAVKLEGRMTPYPATKYRPYVSKLAHSAQAASWVQFDLGAATAVEGRSPVSELQSRDSLAGVSGADAD